MSVLTIRVPEEKHQRLKELAEAKKMSLNRLFDEMSTRILTEYDVEQRLKARAALGSAEDGLALLDEFARYDLAHGFSEKKGY